MAIWFVSPCGRLLRCVVPWLLGAPDKRYGIPLSPSGKTPGGRAQRMNNDQIYQYARRLSTLAGGYNLNRWSWYPPQALSAAELTRVVPFGY